MAALAAVACEDPEPMPDPVQPVDEAENTCALILNEGTWGANNASISLLKKGTLTVDWFSSVNGRGLGDLAQDLVVYGTKAYVTVSESGSLEVIDTATGVATRVDLGTRYPRYIAADGGKLYISCYHPRSVIRIDTTSMQIEATCELGDFNPEGLAVAEGKLFAASSNISDEFGNYSYDNNVYVIDLSTFANPQTVAVGSNPQKIMNLGDGRVLVNYWGDYDSNPAGSAIVDASSLAVTQTGVEMANMALCGSIVYSYSINYDNYPNTTAEYVSLDLNTLATTPVSIAIDNPYSIAVDVTSGNIYIGTNEYGTNCDLHCFSPEGSLKWKREVGVLPSKIVFL